MHRNFTLTSVDKVVLLPGIEYIATGRYKDTLMEVKTLKPNTQFGQVVWFNNNISLNDYLQHRTAYQYDADISMRVIGVPEVKPGHKFEMVRYYSTGRYLLHQGMKHIEYARHDNPQDVLFKGEGME